MLGREKAEFAWFEDPLRHLFMVPEAIEMRLASIHLVATLTSAGQRCRTPARNFSLSSRMSRTSG